MFTFVETSVFSRVFPEYLDDEAYAELQVYLDRLPDEGAVVPGTGGVRKLRWAAGRRGTRGGLRVIYYIRRGRGEIWLLTLYGKSVREDIPVHILRKIREATENG